MRELYGGWLRRRGGAALLLVAVLVAGCGPGGPSASPPVGGGGSPGTPASSAAAADRLRSALDKMAGGYTFEATVSVGGQVATRAAGRWVGGASEFTVEANGVTITYRTLPPRSWVLQPGTAWVEVAGTVPSGDPLDALRAPTSAVITADRGSSAELRATYPASALGQTGDAGVPVDLALAADGSVTARYALDTKAGPASSETVLKPGTGLAPVVAPSPGATS